MNNEWYTIKNLDGFVNYARSMIFDTFGKSKEECSQNIQDYDAFIDHLTKEETEEIEAVLSYSESLAIVKSLVRSQRNKKTQEIRYLVNDDLFMKILESMNDRMTSNVLNSLVNKGLVETAYDSDLGDFIFWVKDEYKEEKPETD